MLLSALLLGSILQRVRTKRKFNQKLNIFANNKNAPTTSKKSKLAMGLLGGTLSLSVLIGAGTLTANAVENSRIEQVALTESIAASEVLKGVASDKQITLNNVARKADSDTNETVSGKYDSKEMQLARDGILKAIDQVTKIKPLYSSKVEASLIVKTQAEVPAATALIESKFKENSELLTGKVTDWQKEFTAEKDRVAAATAQAEAEAAEVARIEAERVAAEQAEAQAEAERVAAAEAASQQVAVQNYQQAPARSQNAPAPQAPAVQKPAPPAGPVINHFQRTAGVGAQGLIDACAGAVDVTNTMYQGIPALAEHWHCGGASFPTWAGAVVQINGYGIYRVNGIAAVLNHAIHTTGDLPRGHELLYQTCLNNNPATMALISLSKIG